MDFEESKSELKRLLNPFSSENVHKYNIKLARLTFPLITIPDDVDEEEWRLLNHEKFAKDRYMVSSWGRVFDIYHEHYPNSYLCDNGYVALGVELNDAKSLKSNKKYTHTTTRLHRLIGYVFIENPFNKETINHINLDKCNNTINNLEWMTSEENIKHAYDNDAKRNVVRTKYFTKEEIVEIRLKYKNGMNISSLAKEYNKKPLTMSNIVKGISYNDDFWDKLGFNSEQVTFYNKSRNRS